MNEELSGPNKNIDLAIMLLKIEGKMTALMNMQAQILAQVTGTKLDQVKEEMWLDYDKQTKQLFKDLPDSE